MRFEDRPVSAEGPDRYIEEHTQLVGLLKKPFSVALSNNLQHREVLRLRDRLADVPLVTGVRGRGLMIGVQLDRDCGELVGRAREAGLLINVTAGSVVRLLPPLVINDDELRFLVDTLAQVIRDFARDQENP